LNAKIAPSTSAVITTASVPKTAAPRIDANIVKKTSVRAASMLTWPETSGLSGLSVRSRLTSRMSFKHAPNPNSPRATSAPPPRSAHSGPWKRRLWGPACPSNSLLARDQRITNHVLATNANAVEMRVRCRTGARRWSKRITGRG
jgi:hypothetical protein